MTELKAGDEVRTKQAITIITGLRLMVIPQGAKGTVESCVAADAGFVRFAGCGGTLFVHADELDPWVEPTE